MSSKEFVIGLYECLGHDCGKSGGREHLITHCHEEIQWCVHGPPQMSKCGLFTGKDGVVSFFTELDKCWEFTSPLKILDMMVTEDSRTVVVTTEEHGIDCATKVPFGARGCHIWNLAEATAKKEANCPVGSAYCVVGFTEWLCVYPTDGPGMPPMGVDVGVAAEATSSPVAAMPAKGVPAAKMAKIDKAKTKG
jgi:hypothetical protein